MLCLSGSAVSTMTSTCDLASLSLTVPVWTRGGEMDGRMVPATEAVKSRAGGISFIFFLWQVSLIDLTIRSKIQNAENLILRLSKVGNCPFLGIKRLRTIFNSNSINTKLSIFN